MEYNNFKDLDISEIGMGCYALSGSYGSVDIENYGSVLNKANKLGVNLFDTAATYGEEAEKILGEVIEPMREDVVVSTKIGVDDEGKPSLSFNEVKEQCENSLNRLRTEYIDIYLVHFDDPNTPVEETVDALEDLKREDKIKHYGVSHLPAERVKEYLEKGNVSFCLMELSPVARKAREELLPLCKEHGAKAIAFSVTGRGILSGEIDENTKFEEGDIREMDPLFKKERFKSALRITREFKDIGEKYDKTPIQVAINWTLSQEGVISALTGPSSLEHLKENVDGSGWELENADLEKIESIIKREDEILEEREPQILKKILEKPLHKDTSRAYSDLIYVMEVAIERNMTEEKDILPIYRKLLTERKEGLTPDKLEKIQDELRGVIF
ncbi:MAG: aldo/keto reductase [Thermoplasmata archaeon]